MPNITIFCKDNTTRVLRVGNFPKPYELGKAIEGHNFSHIVHENEAKPEVKPRENVFEKTRVEKDGLKKLKFDFKKYLYTKNPELVRMKYSAKQIWKMTLAVSEIVN